MISPPNLKKIQGKSTEFKISIKKLDDFGVYCLTITDSGTCVVFSCCFPFDDIGHRAALLGYLSDAAKELSDTIYYTAKEGLL